jgi:hypothetical protein
MVATSEPTLPSFCVCGTNLVNVQLGTGSYNYTNVDYCAHLDQNISIHIRGKLSDDPSTPGFLHENAELLNHTVGKLDPNMIFHVNRQPEYEPRQQRPLAYKIKHQITTSHRTKSPIKEVFTYACIGKLPPIIGQEKFSFNILSRSNNYTDKDLAQLVSQANATSSGLLDLQDIRYNNASTYALCNMPLR